jgi:hypothetical protein
MVALAPTDGLVAIAKERSYLYLTKHVDNCVIPAFPRAFLAGGIFPQAACYIEWAEHCENPIH